MKKITFLLQGLLPDTFVHVGCRKLRKSPVVHRCSFVSSALLISLDYSSHPKVIFPTKRFPSSVIHHLHLGLPSSTHRRVLGDGHCSLQGGVLLNKKVRLLRVSSVLLDLLSQRDLTPLTEGDLLGDVIIDGKEADHHSKGDFDQSQTDADKPELPSEASGDHEAAEELDSTCLESTDDEEDSKEDKRAIKESSKEVELVVQAAGVEDIESLHEDESVEDDSSVDPSLLAETSIESSSLVLALLGAQSVAKLRLDSPFSSDTLRWR